ncbi:hypothetical protein GPROT1_00096, partial [Gammaproteobacteria bacterium]
DWRPNPYLPGTRGELAVPIKLREEVLGILDVQSDRVGALTDEDRLLLEGLCGQIAIAMESQRLLDNVQQSERLMRTLIDAIPDHIYAKDLEGRLILANSAEARLHGVDSPDLLIGKSDFDFYPPELAERYRASELPVLHDGLSLLNHEEPNVDATGQLHWSTTTKVPLRNQEGRIVGLVGSTRDITERKQTEQALSEEHTRLRTLIDNLPVSVYIKDRDSRFVVNNAVHLRILGAASQEEVSGKWDFDYFPPELAEQYYADEQELMRIGQPLFNREESVVDQSSGQQHWALSTKVPLRDAHGQVTGFLGFTQDITERKLAEEAVRRSQADLSQALQIARLAYWEYDVAQDLFHFNDQFYAIFHTTAEQQGGYHLSSAQYAQRFVYPDDLPVVGAE